MRNPTRKPDRAAIARSLHLLEKLFGRKRPPENESAAGKSGADDTLLTGKLKRGGVR